MVSINYNEYSIETLMLLAKQLSNDIDELDKNSNQLKQLFSKEKRRSLSLIKNILINKYDKYSFKQISYLLNICSTAFEKNLFSELLYHRLEQMVFFEISLKSKLESVIYIIEFEYLEKLSQSCKNSYIRQMCQKRYNELYEQLVVADIENWRKYKYN